MTVMECPETLARCCKEAGCQKLTHHDLRHFFATRLIEKGIDIPTVAKMLGHADGGALAMKVYGHLRMAYLQKRLQNLRFNADAVQPQAMLPSSGPKSNVDTTEMSEFRALLEKVLAAQSDGRQPVIDLNQRQPKPNEPGGSDYPRPDTHLYGSRFGSLSELKARS